MIHCVANIRDHENNSNKYAILNNAYQVTDLQSKLLLIVSKIQPKEKHEGDTIMMQGVAIRLKKQH